MLQVQALTGLKIVEFGMAIVAPLITKWLADCGATVVKVESDRKIDILRVISPYAGDKPGLNRTVFYTYNDSKYSLALNMDNPQGLAVARKLVGWADVVVENFSTGTLDKWGLDFEGLKKIRSDIIMLRVSNQGQKGPNSKHKGFGGQLSGLAGLIHLVGWPDRIPPGMPNAHTDFISPFYGIAAIMSALSYRQKTGQGTWIDLPQFESAVTTIAPAILDYAVNGRIQNANGNRCTYASPHGAYRCRGKDRWCTIAVFNDLEWSAFCQAIGKSEWINDQRFNTILRRKKNEDELDKLVEQWTSNQTPHEVMKILQKAGVSAGIIQNAEDIFNDPQLRHREHFWPLNHPEMGKVSYETPSFRLSKTPVQINRRAPLFGEHTEYVCKNLLRISNEEFDQLLIDGAVTLPL